MKLLRCSGESYKRRSFQNGLRVLERDFAGPLFHVRAAFRVGFDDETADTLEAAHFLEHMLAKFTSTRYPSGRRNNALLSDAGATTNASTSAWETDYYVEAPISSAPRVLDVVVNALADFRIDEDAVVAEGNAVREELRTSWIDDVFYEGNTARDKWLFGAHVRAQSGEAHLASVERLIADPSRLVAFHRRHYRPNRLVLVVVGPLRALRPSLETMYERLCGLVAARSPDARSPARPPPPATRAFPSRGATSTEVTVRWALGCTNANTILRTDLTLARVLLTGDFASRLLHSLRTVHKLVYAVSVHDELDRHDPALSFVEVHATCRPEDARRVVEVVREQVRLDPAPDERRRVALALTNERSRRAYCASPARVAAELQDAFLWRDVVEDADERLSLALGRNAAGAPNHALEAMRREPHVTLVGAV